MDRVHFIERQIERLDDGAFAALLTWFDHYADLRWTGRCALDGSAQTSMPSFNLDVGVLAARGSRPIAWGQVPSERE